jgi:hypothetical protein
MDKRRPERPPAALVPRLAALVSTIVIALIFGGPAATRAADSFGEVGEPVPGKRVYDQADLLSPAEEADLERRADAVARASAPTIVFLRRDDGSSDYAATEDDARVLMNAWDVESAEGAKDGPVVLVHDWKPDYPNLPTALWAGEAHPRGGNLPPAELNASTSKRCGPTCGPGGSTTACSAARPRSSTARNGGRRQPATGQTFRSGSGSPSRSS